MWHNFLLNRFSLLLFTVLSIKHSITFSGNGYYLFDSNNENGGDLCTANNSEVNNTSGNDTSSENNVISDSFTEPDDYVEPPEDGVVFTQNQIFVVSLWFWW